MSSAIIEMPERSLNIGQEEKEKNNNEADI